MDARPDPESVKDRRRQRRALAIIMATVMINMIGVGIAWPVLPKLVQTMGDGTVSSASAAYAIIATLFALSQFLFSPLLGTLSDRFGRRPVLLVSLTGLGIDYLLTALVPNLFWLAVVRFVGGIFAATATTANAYAADISTPENRARNFGLIGAMFGIGFILGPLIGGFLGEIDIHLPFYAAAALAGINVLFGWFLLPESLAEEKRSTVALSEANPLRSLARIASFPQLGPLLIALFLTATAQRGLEATWVLYTEFRFGWTLFEAAWSLTFVGVMYFAIQGFAVGPVVRRFGEWTTVIASFAISGFSLIIYAIADQGWMVYPLIALYVIGNGLGGPALNSICSRTVSDREQGRLSGSLNAVNALAIIAGPFLASVVLAGVSANPPVVNIPGLWFILSAAAFVLALILARRGHRKLDSNS